MTGGGDLDGVVRLRDGVELFSGTLLADGRHVLTAAHGLRGGALPRVEFAVPSGILAVPVTAAFVHPLFDPANGNFDLAIVTLAEPAPLAANRHEIYRGSDEVGQTAILAGWGLGGTGATGATGVAATSAPGVAENHFDATVGALTDWAAGALAWSPAANALLLADFDDGTAAHDAAGRLLGLADTGLGAAEGLIASGDSGGPALLNGQIAGVAAYVFSLEQGLTVPDADGVDNNSSFGEFGAWTRVSVFGQWVDSTARADLPGAPRERADVVRVAAEGDTATSLAYFLLELSAPAGADGARVAYRTMEGSAHAGEDFLPVAGWSVIYPGESAAVIAVEVVGDSLVEGDETFGLEITAPQGGSFSHGAIRLVAYRTIADDDAAVSVGG